jgi:hypothetical protein
MSGACVRVIIALTWCVVCGLTAGCSAATWQGVAQGLAAASPTAAPAAKLMVFGGADHKTLGCVNCNEYASDSIFNSYGTHGSKYAVDSVSNHYSHFGSAYSTEGACSPYASDPPVVVDGNGQFYGRLTLNQYHPQRINDSRLLAWLAAICVD